jgi:prolipoprotein diacylglyceryl transferase
MYPTFADFFRDLTGWQLPFPFTLIQSFGLLVACSFLFAAWCLTIELKRKEADGLLKPFTKITKKGEEIIHPYMLVGNATIVAAIFGFLGSKIFDFLENPSEFSDFLHNPGANIFSGLTFYGGLIIAAFAVVYYTRKNGIPPIHMVDATAPSLMLAYGVGRLGCQIAGDGDWGINNLAPKPGWMGFLPDWFWAYKYPHNVIGEGIPIPGCEGNHCFQLPEPVFPTPLYEAITCILLFFLLWSFRKKIKAPGVMFCFYLILNGIERFAIESIRINTQYHIFGIGITQAQIISPIMFLLGVIGIIYFHNKYKTKLSNES